MSELHRAMRSALAIVIAAAFAFLPRAAHADAAAVAVSSVDTSHYPTISMTVTVPPGAGPIDSNGFAVSDGTATVAPSVNLLAGDDLRVMLLFDTSGSMAGAPLDAAKSAAKTFVAAIPRT